MFSTFLLAYTCNYCDPTVAIQLIGCELVPDLYHTVPEFSNLNNNISNYLCVGLYSRPVCIAVRLSGLYALQYAGIPVLPHGLLILPRAYTH